MTVAEYLREWHRVREERLSESAWHRYRGLIEQWLVPLLGSVPLAKLQPLQIEQAYETMRKSPRKDGRPGTVSPTTVHHAHCVLHKALRDAVKKRLIPYNPADAVEAPRRKRKEPRAYTEEEVNRLLAAAEGTRLYAPIALAAYTDMRLGEVLGLRWEDVDFEDATIFVRRALKRSKERGLVLEEPKTAKSRRRIEIGPDTIAVLKRQKKLQAEWRLKAGPAWQDTGLVCTMEDGSPV